MDDRRSAPGPRPSLKRITEMGPQWIIKMRNHPQRTMLCASFQKSRSRAFLRTLPQKLDTAISVALS